MKTRFVSTTLVSAVIITLVLGQSLLKPAGMGAIIQRAPEMSRGIIMGAVAAGGYIGLHARRHECLQPRDRRDSITANPSMLSQNPTYTIDEPPGPSKTMTPTYKK